MGGELCRNEFEEFCKKCGIERKNTTPYTPQHNGVVKGMNKMLMEKERNPLSSVGIRNELWEEAMDTTCYLVNQSSTSTLVKKTPQEVWNGKKNSIKDIQVFYCDDYVHVLKEKRSMLDNKAEKCIFIGYKDGMC